MKLSKKLMLFVAFMGVLFSLSLSALAAESKGYYRWPTVYGDKVVFNSEGDLWTVSTSGGMARRLTTATGNESFPMFSPDGKWIAFSGNYDGNVDVYVIPADGGEPKRLTYYPTQDLVTAWTPDGKVAFRSQEQKGVVTWMCYTVSPEGGYPEMVPVDEAAHLTFEPNGDRIAYTRVSLGTRTWKRYKGGWAEDIWVGSTKTHDYKMVTPNDGNDAIPMWYKDRIYYLRDNDARMNIHSMKPDGSDIKQHTNFTEWDCRWPSLSQGKIAFSNGADIWVYDIDKNEEKKIEILLPSDRTQARDKFVNADDYTGDYALSPDGGRLLLGARGELFTAATEKRSVLHQITRSNDAREKYPTYTPKGDSILTWSDMSGEEALYLYSAKGTGGYRKLANGKGGWNFPVEISPDGKWGVYGDNNRRVNLIDMKSGSTTVFDSSGWEVRAYTWSPDSRYIAYDAYHSSDEEPIGVRIYDTKDNKVHEVTDPLWRSYSPAWDPKGKWLYFISSRFMNPHSSAIDWAFIVQDIDRIYALALDTETKSPYAYEDDAAGSEKKKDDDKKDGEDKDKKDGDKKDKDKDKDKKVEVKIVWEGLQDRIIELPVDAGNYGGLSAIEGKLYYFSRSSDGWLDGRADSDDESSGSALKLFNIKKKKSDTVMRGVNGYTLSGDLKKIAVRKKGSFVIMEAGASKAPEDDDDKSPDEGLHLDGWVYDVDPRLEWKQIFNEAWRLQRDFFYDPGMHGIDWKAQRDKYGSLLNRINTRLELNDVIAEMISELNAGHAYVGGGDAQSAKFIGVGLLGIDVSKHSSGFYKIENILRGDAWDAKNTSPLGAPGMNVKNGDYIVAIDGISTASVDNYLQLLNNKAGKIVVVSVNDKASSEGARDLVLKTIGSESKLRYWDWVYGRMDYVKKHGGEDLAYVHLSDMGSDGMVQWMREYYSQSSKKGLIMDVRYNGGGNIASWILSQLERDVWTFGASRSNAKYKTPGSAFYGHMIALCNEETGSDGETFSEGWKRLKLGPLVGKRTWGGWVGIRGDKALLDKGFYTQPEFTGWGLDRKWLIEGPGVYPDVDLQNSPKKRMEGVDEQLDYAIKYLKDELKKNPKEWTPQPAFPVKSATGYKK